MLMGAACASEGKIRLSALGCFSIYTERDDIIHELREQEMDRNIRQRLVSIFYLCGMFPLCSWQQ